jgi:hypothetical protein
MKNKNDVEISWQRKYFNAAVGYYEMGMLDDAEIELGKIDQSAAVDAIPVLALRLNICYRRKQWNKMAALATQLFLLDASEPRWAYAHGFATAKIDSGQNQAN